MEINEFYEIDENGKQKIKPITVTITLAEYRFLIQENQRLLITNETLVERLNDMLNSNIQER